MDKNLKRGLLWLGIMQAVVAAFMWFFTLGRAEADIVRRPELAAAIAEQSTKLDKLQATVNATREDVGYLRGKLDNPKP